MNGTVICDRVALQKRANVTRRHSPSLQLSIMNYERGRKTKDFDHKYRIIAKLVSKIAKTFHLEKLPKLPFISLCHEYSEIASNEQQNQFDFIFFK